MDYNPEQIQTKSRIGRGGVRRRDSNQNNSEFNNTLNSSLGGTQNFGTLNNINSSSNNNTMNLQQNNNNVNVLSLDNDTSPIQQQQQNINTQSYLPRRAQRGNSRQHNQQDNQEQKLTQEIQDLDHKLQQNNLSQNLNHNSNNNNAYTSNNYESSNNSLGGTGRIRRVRDESVKKNQQNTTNSFGRSTNTSLNATFGNNNFNTSNSNNMNSNTQGLDHFEQKENELKKQLQEYEKRQQQQEKIQQIQENAKRNTQSKLNNNNQGDLKLKLNSPAFGVKQQAQNNNNVFNSNNTNHLQSIKPSLKLKNNNDQNNNNIEEGFGEYIPGNFARQSGNGFNKGGRTINNLQGPQGFSTTNNSNQNSAVKKPVSVKNVDDEIAVATGFQDLVDESYQENVELIMCPEGCGRKFKEQALEKHISVCKKLFANKKKKQDTKKMQEDKKLRDTSVRKSQNKPPVQPKGKSNLADIKKKLKQKVEEQGGQKDDLPLN